MGLKKKNTSHKCDKNAHGCSKYKICLNMIIITCSRQHLSNSWISIHENLKQHWDWVEKRRYKKACMSKPNHFFFQNKSEA